MDVQTIIVGVIILAAVAYVGNLVWKKVGSFSSKAGCKTDCGCDSAAKPKNLSAPISRN